MLLLVTYFDSGPLIPNHTNGSKMESWFGALYSILVAVRRYNSHPQISALKIGGFLVPAETGVEDPKARKLARRPSMKRNTWRWSSSCSRGARTGWYLCDAVSKKKQTSDSNGGWDNLAIAGCFGLIRSSEWLIKFVSESECEDNMGCVANYVQAGRRVVPLAWSMGWWAGSFGSAVSFVCVCVCAVVQGLGLPNHEVIQGLEWIWNGKWSKWIQLMYIV